jgi:hypothetical protein
MDQITNLDLIKGLRLMGIEVSERILRLDETVNGVKNPLSKFKKMPAFDGDGAVIPWSIFQDGNDIDYFDENELDEAPWAHIAAHFLKVKNIKEMAFVESEASDYDEEYFAKIDRAFKSTKKLPAYELGYQNLELGKAFGVDMFYVSDHGYTAYLIRMADKNKGKE